jgi:hypothetical protein
MAMVENLAYMPLAIKEDPGDYRPDSKLALKVSRWRDHHAGFTTI